VGRRHPHFDDGNVGLVRPDLAEQVLSVAGLRDDLEARLGKNPNNALAQEDGVVRDYDS